MVGPHMLSRAVVAATMGRPSTCAAFASPTTLCLSSATDVPDAGEEADLVVDEQDHLVVPGQDAVHPVRGARAVAIQSWVSTDHSNTPIRRFCAKLSVVAL